MKIKHAPVTFTIIVLIAIGFIIEALHGLSFLTPGEENSIQSMLAATNDPAVLVRVGAIVPWTFQSGEYWRLLTAIFLHAGFLHLTLNVWALFQLGYIFENMFGSVRFFFTYFISGLAASLASAMVAQDNSSVGASGAIFGILGALIFAIRRSPFWRDQPWARSLGKQLVVWAALNVVIGFIVPNIDNAAHMGGFIAGLLLGFIPHRVPPPPPREAIIDASPIDQGPGNIERL